MEKYDSYYVNDIAQSTGEHEVHKAGCSFFPSKHTYLGEFIHCRDAVKKARDYYDYVDGCAYCSPDCHTK